MTFLLKVWHEKMGAYSAAFFKQWMKQISLQQRNYLFKLANENIGKKERKMKFNY